MGRPVDDAGMLELLEPMRPRPHNASFGDADAVSVGDYHIPKMIGWSACGPAGRRRRHARAAGADACTPTWSRTYQAAPISELTLWSSGPPPSSVAYGCRTPRFWTPLTAPLCVHTYLVAHVSSSTDQRTHLVVVRAATKFRGLRLRCTLVNEAERGLFRRVCLCGPQSPCPPDPPDPDAGCDLAFTATPLGRALHAGQRGRARAFS